MLTLERAWCYDGEIGCGGWGWGASFTWVSHRSICRQSQPAPPQMTSGFLLTAPQPLDFETPYNIEEQQL